jgi:uncharacterized RDD family membrane protein YckC
MNSEQRTWLEVRHSLCSFFYSRRMAAVHGRHFRMLRGIIAAMVCLGLNQVMLAQDEPAPATLAAPAAEEQPATTPLSPQAEQALIDDTNKVAVPNLPQEEHEWRGGDHGGGWRPPMVVIGRDAEVPAGDSVEALVVIGGSGKVHGRVREAAVVIGGDLDIDGQVGKEAVAILGNISAHKGARVRGDAVAVGGRVSVGEGAHVHMPQGVEFPDLTWLRKWFIQCVLLMRPLSLSVTWVWFIAAIFLLLYLLIASLFPRPVRACVDELTERPATTFCLGLLTIFLTPVVIVILGITGVGLLVVPFVLAALCFGALIGRVALLEWIGWRLAHQFGAQNRNAPLTGLVLGSVVVVVLYLVPILGLLTFALVSLWSLGGAVTAAFGGLRREMPEKTIAEAPAVLAPVVAPAGMTMAAGAEAVQAPGSGSADHAATPVQTPQPIIPSSPPVVPEILTYPKATFWERLGAAFLDIILVGILCLMLHPIAPVVALAYFSGLWFWKGTTIGGIVIGLKVVRADGKPLTFPVTLVRSLAAAFSVFVLFLGYLWIIWDPEKQGWHDKIAGTVVLRLPKGTPLLCL